MNAKRNTFLIACAAAGVLGLQAVAVDPSTAAPTAGAKTDPAQSTIGSSSTAGETSGTASSGAGGYSQAPQGTATTQPATAMDGIVKHDGEILFLKNGRATAVDKDMKLSEGINVNPSGELVLKDGTRMTLQEGQMVTLDGKVTKAPESIFGSSAAAQPGSGAASPGQPEPASTPAVSAPSDR